MINYLFAAFLAFTLYWVWRNLYYIRLNQRYRFKFFALRDQLRRAAIEERIDQNSKAFKFIDASLSRSACDMERFNMFTFMILGAINQDNVNLKQRVARVHME